MPSLVITLEVAAVAALINIWLGMRCGKARMAGKVLHGDGGDPMLIRRMRGQANFIENAPIFLILLGLVEYTLGSSYWLWFIGVIFLIARILHPIGLDKDGANLMRGAGTLLSMLTILILAIVALLAAFGLIKPI